MMYDSFDGNSFDSLDAVIDDLADVEAELQAMIAAQDRRCSWALAAATQIALEVRMNSSADGP